MALALDHAIAEHDHSARCDWCRERFIPEPSETVCGGCADHMKRERSTTMPNRIRYAVIEVTAPLDWLTDEEADTTEEKSWTLIKDTLRFDTGEVPALCEFKPKVEFVEWRGAAEDA
jgi:hypothetical protein